jgi:hypothetical protein
MAQPAAAYRAARTGARRRVIAAGRQASHVVTSGSYDSGFAFGFGTTAQGASRPVRHPNRPLPELLDPVVRNEVFRRSQYL